MASYNENQKFHQQVIGEWLLDDTVDWIAANLSPLEVYTEEQLFTEVIDNSDPESVFGEHALKEWALENGFVEV